MHKPFEQNIPVLKKQKNKKKEGKAKDKSFNNELDIELIEEGTDLIKSENEALYLYCINHLNEICWSSMACTIYWKYIEGWGYCSSLIISGQNM